MFKKYCDIKTVIYQNSVVSEKKNMLNYKVENLSLKVLLSLTMCMLCAIVVAQQTPKWMLLNQSVRESKTFLPIDMIYEPQIRTVQLYSIVGKEKLPQMNTPVLPLSQPSPLVLEFDEVVEEGDYFSAKIIHCNHDWSVSELSAIEYMKDYNEFQIQEYEFSMNTKVPFVHFRFEVPKVSRSGNYILKVYREGDEDDIILTRRFIIYEGLVGVQGKIEQAVGGKMTDELHQVNFSINYGNLDIPFPAKSVWATIRQNNRWDNAIMGLAPRFVRTHESLLEYNYFNMENAFLAGNEFRMFGFRNLSGSGFHVKTIQNEGEMDRIILYPDIKRGDKSFNQQQQDLNGNYFIEVLGRSEARYEADYKEVVFTLKTDEVEGDVFLLGKFTDWHLQDDFKMTYLPEQGVYMGSAILKQGIYNYCYAVLSKDGKKSESDIEGDYRLTKNNYEVIVYYRKIGDRGDRVIGYKQIQ